LIHTRRGTDRHQDLVAVDDRVLAALDRPRKFKVAHAVGFVPAHKKVGGYGPELVVFISERLQVRVVKALYLVGRKEGRKVGRKEGR
jgi:hypothetical protein